MLTIYSGYTAEQIKSEVLTSLYLTGRYNKMYFGIKAKTKVNPLKAYINRFLAINGVLDIDNDFCEECYQHVFTHLWNKPAEKIVSILEESPNGSKLIATACFIISRQCFSRKQNPKQSGLIFNMMNGSTYGGVNISTSESYNDSDSEIIIYDDDFEEESFVKKYDFSVEELVSRLSPEDQQSFYDLIDKKQKRGKPTKEVQAKKQELYEKLRTIKEELKDDQ
ncbi:hypothetical protein [Mucilaginibacter sp. 3215]|uniref:hypothetical protein n=1 Tax=Mucilaginibacter sp. 3215 TaxID=3373912 RepID=UPI003D1A33A0